MLLYTTLLADMFLYICKIGQSYIGPCNLIKKNVLVNEGDFVLPSYFSIDNKCLVCL